LEEVRTAPTLGKLRLSEVDELDDGVVETSDEGTESKQVSGGTIESSR
jgi:hypothetical protein